MSLYHFTMKQILRSEGKAVVNSAAYRAGERLVDDYYGQTWDYTKVAIICMSDIEPKLVKRPFSRKNSGI